MRRIPSLSFYNMILILLVLVSIAHETTGSFGGHPGFGNGGHQASCCPCHPSNVKAVIRQPIVITRYIRMCNPSCVRTTMPTTVASTDGMDSGSGSGSGSG